MKIKAYLDLEDTIIESFTKPDMVNHEKLRELFDHFDISRVIIFSFAVWNSADNSIYQERMQPFLSKYYGVDMKEVLLMSDVNKRYGQTSRNMMDDIDFSGLLGKQGAFIEHVKDMRTGDDTFLLIDDAIDNATIYLRDTNTTIHLVNILTYASVGLPVPP